MQETCLQVLALCESKKEACMGLTCCVKEGSCSGERFTGQNDCGVRLGVGDKTLFKARFRDLTKRA